MTDHPQQPPRRTGRVGSPPASADPPQDSWTPAVIPDLTGHTAVVTGANSGIGFTTALQLVRHGCRVLLACRDAGRGAEALRRVGDRASGSTEMRLLDLADLGSVRGFVAGLQDGPQPLERLDLLVNNAGVMAIQARTSVDGFELQLATNHLGAFALTGLLLPLLLRGTMPGGPARVVTVSSLMHRTGRLNRADLMLRKGYTPYKAYAQSKLANLLFMAELQRRTTAARAPLASLAAHPGYAATNLQAVGPTMSGSRWMARAMTISNRLLAQSAEQGSWPSLRAATDPNAHGGEFYGPGRYGGSRGRPVLSAVSGQASDADAAAWLWNRSVELTGVGYPELGSP